MKNAGLVLLLISCSSVFCMEPPQSPQRGQKRPASEVEQPAAKVPAAAQPPVVMPVVANMPAAALPAAPESRTALELFPDEIKNYILSFLTTARGATKRARLDNAAENIRAFFRINTQFAPLGDDPKIIEYLITELANRYADGDRLAAAIALGTESVGRWLSDLLNNHYAKRDYLSHVVFQTMQDHFTNAAAAGRINVIKFLLQFVPNYAYEWHKALRLAVKNNRIEVVHLILFLSQTQGIRHQLANFQDIAERETPIFDAVQNNNEPMVDLLLDAGANVNKINWVEATPLAIAAENHNASIIKKLLARGVRLDILNLINADTGETPLTTVISGMGDLDTIKALLDAGANINQVNGNGETPLEVAEDSIFPDVIEFLKERGARK